MTVLDSEDPPKPPPIDEQHWKDMLQCARLHASLASIQDGYGDPSRYEETKREYDDVVARVSREEMYFARAELTKFCKQKKERPIPPKLVLEKVAGPPTAPIELTQQDMVNAFQAVTPMSQLFRLITQSGIAWASDCQDSAKAYVMACFSEIAYLHLKESELAERDRYKIFEPSLALADFKRRRLRFDLVRIGAALEIQLEIIETQQFVYVVANVGYAAVRFVVVAVRGTVATTLRDWALDLDALKNVAQHGFYHRGFSDEAERALPLLRKAVGTREPLYFTGHSLGAAVASILTQIWPEQTKTRIPYVFASPRFGTRAAATRLPRYSYVRPFDLVPHAPPRIVGYSDEGSLLTVLPPGSKQSGGWRSLWHTVSRRTAEHHSMEGIRKLLGDIVNETFSEQVYIDAVVAKLTQLHARKLV